MKPLDKMTLLELVNELEMWPGGTAADAAIEAELERRQRMLDAAEKMAAALLMHKRHLVDTFPAYPPGQSPFSVGIEAHAAYLAAKESTNG